MLLASPNILLKGKIFACRLAALNFFGKSGSTEFFGKEKGTVVKPLSPFY